MKNSILSAPAIGAALAVAGGVASLALLWRASSGSTAATSVQLGFAIWVALPFALAFAVDIFCLRAPAGHSLSIPAAVASGALALSTLLYARSVLAPRGSTEALIFVFLPLWSLIGGTVIMLALYWGMRWRRGAPGP